MNLITMIIMSLICWILIIIVHAFGRHEPDAGDMVKDGNCLFGAAIGSIVVNEVCIFFNTTWLNILMFAVLSLFEIIPLIASILCIFSKEVSSYKKATGLLCNIPLTALALNILFKCILKTC